MFAYNQSRDRGTKPGDVSPSHLGQPTRPFAETAECPGCSPGPAPVQEKENTTGLPGDPLQKMEKKYNTDFSNVKIFPISIRTRDVDATAFTRSNRQGHEIHFAPGEFSPRSASGQRILDHELGHVLQQRQGIVRPTTSIKGLTVNDDAALENEAGPVE